MIQNKKKDAKNVKRYKKNMKDIRSIYIYKKYEKIKKNIQKYIKRYKRDTNCLLYYVNKFMDEQLKIKK